MKCMRSLNSMVSFIALSVWDHSIYAKSVNAIMPTLVKNENAGIKIDRVFHLAFNALGPDEAYMR